MDFMGVFGGVAPFQRITNAFGNWQAGRQVGQPTGAPAPETARGLAGLFRKWRASSGRPARLALVERITLGPRQALLLVEADGLRLLVATSSEGTPAFYPLHAELTEMVGDSRPQHRRLVSRRTGPGAWQASRTGSDASTDRDPDKQARVSW
jgi:hypothetical protein